jgi:predicted ribosome quality control (RQC) complex YloA/Tae2 family protein
MNSEKVKEIKDNITICSTKIECKGCSLFPDMKSTNCRNKLLAEALTLINELESENERIKRSKNIAVYRLEHRIDRLEHQIAEMEEDKEKWQRKAVNYYQMAKSYGIECIIDNDIDGSL